MQKVIGEQVVQDKAHKVQRKQEFVKGSFLEKIFRNQGFLWPVLCKTIKDYDMTSRRRLIITRQSHFCYAVLNLYLSHHYGFWAKHDWPRKDKHYCFPCCLLKEGKKVDKANSTYFITRKNEMHFFRKHGKVNDTCMVNKAVTSIHILSHWSWSIWARKRPCSM